MRDNISYEIDNAQVSKLTFIFLIFKAENSKSLQNTALSSRRSTKTRKRKENGTNGISDIINISPEEY